MEAENRLLTRDEIYRILSTALARKLPEPPADWCASGLDEEVRKATREYEPNADLRQKDALCTSLNYLVAFALRMPEWINLTTSNDRVKQICENLTAEIVKITLEPEAVINKHGKLKAWLKAILSVESCLIYRTETDRVIAEEDESKRLRRTEQSKKSSLQNRAQIDGKWQSALAKSIFQKATSQKSENPSEQPSLF